MKNNLTGRPVEFQLDNEDLFIKGWFLELSTDWEEFEQGIGQAPCILVEDESGYVHILHYMGSFRFTDRDKPDN